MMGDLAKPQEEELNSAELSQSDEQDQKESHSSELGTLLNRITIKVNPRTKTLWLKHKNLICTFLLLVFLSVYCLFGIMISGFENSKDLFVVLVIAAVIVTYVAIRDEFGKQINVLLLNPASKKIDEHWRILKWYVLLKVIIFWVV